ncbi:hypothetical protein X777_08312 [Ooceraea biroi]|uniref:Uncharacterized protein n=1 Tax=Ooceraea biroi TaxID=2015173 RepID=A0A026WYJ6_OOCBI|nr:hypothetical protein X777_08312 [Ooceraea biroi]
MRSHEEENMKQPTTYLRLVPEILRASVNPIRELNRSRENARDAPDTGQVGQLPG